MKLLVVTGAIHYKDNIKKIFKDADIANYSHTQISGHTKKEVPRLSSNWFAQSNEDQNSVMFFSFAPSNKTKDILQLIEDNNNRNHSKSNIRGYVMPVENCTKI